MTSLWDELEGVYLAGTYGLERYLGSEPDGAFFRTTFGPQQRPAALKLVPASAGGGENQLALWRKAARLSHPNLLSMLDCGRAETAGNSFLYAVFEYPEDNLAGALANGALSQPEAEAVMAAVEDALRYIHESGMVHTAVDPEHIVAVGDRIKLTADSLRNSGDGGADASGDERAAEALRLRLGLAPRPVQKAEAPAKAIIEPPVQPELREAAPPPAPALTLTVPRRPPALPLLLAAIGAVVIAIVLAVTQRGTSDAPWTPVASAAPATPAPPAASTAKVPAAEPAVAKSAPVAPKPDRPATHARPRENWRVIAYTYNHRDHAEHKVQTINREKPGFHAAVFAPRGNQPPFFVALGGRMSRDDAVALQRRAISKGLPRDTFVRNFSE